MTPDAPLRGLARQPGHATVQTCRSRPGRERGLRVFDRVRIWSGESGNVHYEIRDASDVPFVHGAMSESDWKDLRAKQIQTYPPNVSVSLLTDLIAILAIVAEDF